MNESRLGCVGLRREEEEERGREEALGVCRDARKESKASAGSRREGLTEESCMCGKLIVSRTGRC